MFRMALAVRAARLAALLLAGTLAACGSSRHATGPYLAAASRHPGITCAPFARELSGVALYGEAHTWWVAAQRRYEQASSPQVGAVLVFRRGDRLRSGHVAVVSRVLARRQVLVIQA